MKLAIATLLLLLGANVAPDSDKPRICRSRRDHNGYPIERQVQVGSKRGSGKLTSYALPITFVRTHSPSPD
jgi:hypothetical protein